VKTVASAKTAHVIPLAKFNAQFLERGVFTASARCHGGFDDTKEPNISDYYDLM